MKIVSFILDEDGLMLFCNKAVSDTTSGHNV